MTRSVRSQMVAMIETASSRCYFLCGFAGQHNRIPYRRRMAFATSLLLRQRVRTRVLIIESSITVAVITTLRARIHFSSSFARKITSSTGISTARSPRATMNAVGSFEFHRSCSGLLVFDLRDNLDVFAAVGFQMLANFDNVRTFTDKGRATSRKRPVRNRGIGSCLSFQPAPAAQ